MHKSVDGRGAAPLAEACNTGFEPLVRLNVPALRRSRLSWVWQNYVRAETLTRANARIVAAQASIPLARAWGGGDVASADGLERLRALDPGGLPLVEGEPRFGPCVGRIGKFICIGLNYADYAAEAGLPVPAEPVVFGKWTSAVCGAADDVEIPRGSAKTDWEVELGVVIGSPCKHVTEAEALERVAGYCVVNDVSEREWQNERGGQWDKGKGFDTFGPIGPWLVTRDEVPDPQALDLWLEVDGHRYQNGNMRTMIFGVAALVAYLSRCMSLQPGDVVSTGTPPGVGLGIKPAPVYLRPGQVMRLGISGLGEQRQRTVQDS